MAKVRVKRSVKKPARSTQKTRQLPLLERLNDKFPNFLLGLTVVVLASLVLSLIFQTKNINTKTVTSKVASFFKLNKEERAESRVRTYTVKRGDTLWAIAEEAYGSGFNAFDLAKVNRLIDPNALNEGVVLQLPAMEPKLPTQGEVASGVFTTKEQTPQPTLQTTATAKNVTYTVQAGDSLWMIAMRTYGNPYRWTEIWRNNPSVTNPDLIYAGSKLKLTNF